MTTKEMVRKCFCDPCGLRKVCHCSRCLQFDFVQYARAARRFVRMEQNEKNKKKDQKYDDYVQAGWEQRPWLRPLKRRNGK